MRYVITVQTAIIAVIILMGISGRLVVHDPSSLKVELIDSSSIQKLSKDYANRFDLMKKIHGGILLHHNAWDIILSNTASGRRFFAMLSKGEKSEEGGYMISIDDTDNDGLDDVMYLVENSGEREICVFWGNSRNLELLSVKNKQYSEWDESLDFGLTGQYDVRGNLADLSNIKVSLEQEWYDLQDGNYINVAGEKKKVRIEQGKILVD